MRQLRRPKRRYENVRQEAALAGFGRSGVEPLGSAGTELTDAIPNVFCHILKLLMIRYVT